MKLAAARGKEFALAVERDFFQGFQAVGDEAGADHIDASGFAMAEFFQRGLGVRFEPFGLAEARLEGDQILLRAQAQGLCNEPAGLLAFDLYSQGKDGASVPPLSGPGGDDIVRGNDGGFIGLGSRF